MCAVNFHQNPNQQRRTFDFADVEKAARELIKKVSFGVPVSLRAEKRQKKKMSKQTSRTE